MRVLDYSNFDLDKVKYHEPRKSQQGGTSVFVNYPDGAVTREDSKIRFMTPKSYLPFGISTYNDKRSLEISLKDSTFLKTLNDFDNDIGEKATLNSENWFGTTCESEEINHIQRKMVRQSKNGDYPPLLKAKLPDECNIFDANNSKVTGTNLITKGCNVQLVIECVGVYGIKKEFGVTWKVVQAKVFANSTINGYAFLEEDEDADPV
jgi:hypothetical protein